MSSRQFSTMVAGIVLLMLPSGAGVFTTSGHSFAPGAPAMTVTRAPQLPGFWNSTSDSRMDASLTYADPSTRQIYAARTDSTLRGGPSESSGHPAAFPSASGLFTYRLDPGQSRFLVHVSVAGLLSAFAHNHTVAIGNFSGSVSFTPGSSGSPSIEMVIPADSLTIIDRVSEKDRQEIETTMRNQVLEASAYPQIVFRSTGISVEQSGQDEYRAKISGRLTLHGVTREGLIYANVVASGDTLRAEGSFPLRQTDYNIKPVSIAGGTIKVKDELRLTFKIVAHR